VAERASSMPTVMTIGFNRRTRDLAAAVSVLETPSSTPTTPTLEAALHLAQLLTPSTSSNSVRPFPSGSPLRVGELGLFGLLGFSVPPLATAIPAIPASCAAHSGPCSQWVGLQSGRWSGHMGATSNGPL